jgi:serine/threonine-protein kinase RsbW
MEKRHLNIPAQMPALAEARAFVGEAAHAAKVSERGTFRCQLAVDEACSNIIEHGFQGGDAGKVIRISVWADSDRFYVMLHDSSPPFNPLQQPDPNINLPLEERPTGKLGVFFIKRVMDEVHYQRENDENILTMGMHLSASS